MAFRTSIAGAGAPPRRDVETAYAVLGRPSCEPRARGEATLVSQSRRARLRDSLRALIAPAAGVDGARARPRLGGARGGAFVATPPRAVDLPAPTRRRRRVNLAGKTRAGESRVSASRQHGDRRAHPPKKPAAGRCAGAGSAQPRMSEELGARAARRLDADEPSGAPRKMRARFRRRAQRPRQAAIAFSRAVARRMLPSGRLTARARVCGLASSRAAVPARRRLRWRFGAFPELRCFRPVSVGALALKRDARVVRRESLRAHGQTDGRVCVRRSQVARPTPPAAASATRRRPATLTSLTDRVGSAPLKAADAVRRQRSAAAKASPRPSIGGRWTTPGTEAAEVCSRGPRARLRVAPGRTSRSVCSRLRFSLVRFPPIRLSRQTPSPPAGSPPWETRTPPPRPLLDASGTPSAAAVARWAREYRRAWLAHATVALGILDDAIGAETRE